MNRSDRKGKQAIQMTGSRQKSNLNDMSVAQLNFYQQTSASTHHGTDKFKRSLYCKIELL